MRIGQMRHRLGVQALTEARDVHGGVTTTWATAANRWGEILPEKANERDVAERRDSVVTHRIRMRWYEGLVPTQRLRFGTRIFKIIEILDQGERNRAHLIMAQELVP